MRWREGRGVSFARKAVRGVARCARCGARRARWAGTPARKPRACSGGGGAVGSCSGSASVRSGAWPALGTGVASTISMSTRRAAPLLAVPSGEASGAGASSPIASSSLPTLGVRAASEAAREEGAEGEAERERPPRRFSARATAAAAPRNAPGLRLECAPPRRVRIGVHACRGGGRGGRGARQGKWVRPRGWDGGAVFVSGKAAAGGVSRHKGAPGRGAGVGRRRAPRQRHARHARVVRRAAVRAHFQRQADERRIAAAACNSAPATAAACSRRVARRRRLAALRRGGQLLAQRGRLVWLGRRRAEAGARRQRVIAALLRRSRARVAVASRLQAGQPSPGQPRARRPQAAARQRARHRSRGAALLTRGAFSTSRLLSFSRAPR
jgi:hypothetical protein